MSRLIPVLAASALAASALGLGPAASAPARSGAAAGRQCFFTNQIRATQPIGDRQVNVLVNLNDVYRIDLAQPCNSLRQPQRVLELTSTGGSSICGGADTRLAVLIQGSREECFVQSVTRLTPQEVADLPKRDRP